MSLWRELRQRNVFKVGTAYLAVAWLVTQVVTGIEDPLGLPDSFATIIVVLLAIGFPIALVIAWAFELTPEGIRRTDPDSSQAASNVHSSNHRLNYFITAVLVLAVGFLLVDRFMPGDAPAGNAVGPAAASVGGPAETARSPASPALDQRIRLAVLPLRALSSDDELGFFADGLSEQLIRELKQIPELLVTDRGASFEFKDKEVPYRDIAEALGVAHILDGTIASDGDRLRIAVSLTRTEDDAQLWDSTRDFAQSEIFAVQDDITSQVATALSVSLGVLESRRPGMTRNVEAYTTYLTGLGYAQTFDIDLMRSARQLYQRAIALDPQFVAPRIAMYFNDRNMVPLVSDEEANELRRRSDETLALVRTMVPNATEVALIDAIRSLTEGNWGDLQGFLRGEQSAGLPTADERGSNATVGTFLLRVGRVREAITFLETARALAPQEPGLSFNLVAAYEAAGDLDAAFAEIERARALSSDNVLLAGQLLLTALASRDREILEEQLARTADSPLELWRAIGGLLDDRESAVAEIRRRFEESVDETVLEVGLLAHWANYFEEPALALEIMRSMPSDAPILTLMIWDYGMRDARKLPQFKEIVSNLNLVDYWREYGWPDFCHPVDEDFECE